MSAVAEASAERPLQSLSSGWAWARLGDICDAINGRAFRSSEWRESGLPIVRIQNLKDPEAGFHYFAGELDDRHRVRHGDLLFAWSGTPGTSFGAHIWKGQDGALNQHIFNIKFDPDILDPRYFCLALNQNVSRYVAQAQGGVGLAHITKGKFLNSLIPLAPKAKQLELVAEIEKQFSRLDEGVANLKRVKINLKRYKAAILKAGVEGRLVATEAELARRDGRRATTAFDLLKEGDTPHAKKRAGRLWGSGHVPALTNDEAETLPEGWAWVKVRDLGHSTEDAVQVGPMSMKSSEFSDAGVPVLNVGCVQWDSFEETKLNFLPNQAAPQFARYRIQPGDVLFTRSGTVGRCAVAQPHQANWLMTFHLLRARPDPRKCLPEYLRAVFEGAPHIRRQTREASVGSTRAGFNTNLLAMLDVPLPPLEEQRRIVTEVERLLSIVRAATEEADSAQLRVAALRSAVLGHTFKLGCTTEPLAE